jgi:MFS family permease
LVSLIALVSTLASSIITPGFDDIQSDFDVSSEVALLPFVFYTLGLSIGPLVSGPLSESYGRRNVYASATPLLAAFLLGAGFSQSIAALIVCRFLAGVAGAPGLTIGGATLSDVWRKEERALPWTVYVTTPFLGPALGYVFVPPNFSLVTELPMAKGTKWSISQLISTFATQTVDRWICRDYHWMALDTMDRGYRRSGNLGRCFLHAGNS